MTFYEVWQTLPIPAGYWDLPDKGKTQWMALVEAAFLAGLFEGAHKSASAKTADSKRISDLEAAVAEIRAEILDMAKIQRPVGQAATISALKRQRRLAAG